LIDPAPPPAGAAPSGAASSDAASPDAASPDAASSDAASSGQASSGQAAGAPARRVTAGGRRRADREPGTEEAPILARGGRRHGDRGTAPGAASRPAARRSGDPTTEGDDEPPASGRRPQRARDPEARRRALATAALEVISEVGITRTTHRAVAARAGLPLGATTYYFPTLDDLIAAGLRLSAADLQSDFQEWAGRLREASDIPAAVAALIVEYVTDRQRAQLECELYVAAGRDPALRPLAMAWLTGMRDLLEPHVGADAARDVVTFFDGVTLRALITGQEVDLQALTSAIRRLTTP